MTPKNTTPWIYRWSRRLIAAIAILGFILTSYLTFMEITGQEVLCLASETSGGTCNNVFKSPYGTVFGIPLSIYGMVAYFSMATFALLPLFFNPTTQKTLRQSLENITWQLLLLGSTAMTVASGYLMSVLAFELHTFCPYCITSATFALSFFVLTLIGRYWEDLGGVLLNITLMGVITWVGTLGIFAQETAKATTVTSNGTPIPELGSSPTPGIGWPISTQSGSAEIALARHLKDIGAAMYGAYWCPHCAEQKLLLGKEAMKIVNYIECGRGAENSQQEKCQADKIQGYPSWRINGEIYSGIQSPQKLAEISNYEGSMDFKYTMAGVN